MSQETVFKTTKVRTRLRGDTSWMQKSTDTETNTAEEKPWQAEIRARRLNGPTTVETSPVTSPTKTTPTKPDAERAPQTGFLARGIFTKLDKPASSSTTNGVSGTATQFTKKPSETYKKIAPHTVKTTADNQESQLSTEEKEKRTEAASSVLKKSAVRQRSYVLSAAKKFEAQDTTSNTSVVKSPPSFVARRVEINDEDESNATPTPASPLPPVVPVTSVASAPEPTPSEIVVTSVETIVDVTVNEPVAPKVEEEEAAPEPAEDDSPPASVAVKDPFEGMTPGCTKVDTPLPVLLPEFVQAVHAAPEAEDSDISGQVDIALVDVTPVSPTPVSPPPEAPAPVSPVPLSPAPVSPAPLSPAPVSAVSEIIVKTEPVPAPALAPTPRQFPKPSSSVDTLSALSDTLISFDTTSTSLKDDEPVLAEEEGSSAAESRIAEDGAEEEPKLPELSNNIPLTDNLLTLSEGPEESAEEPVPPSPGRWSQDLLSGLDSESNPAKTSGALDLLAGDVIPIDTEARSLSVQREEEEKPTHETVKETQSLTETVTITTKTVIITDKSQEDNADPWSSQSRVTTTTVTESSSADPFDPYPIGTTSSNSSSDLLQPVSDISINRVTTTFIENNDQSPETKVTTTFIESNDQSPETKVTTTFIENNDQSPETKVTTTFMENDNQSPETINALESLADDVIPIDTDTTRLSSRRSWATTWETSHQQEDTEESQEGAAGGQTVDQQTLVMFERKSKETDSPWDRWTSPTVYTITSTTGEEEEEEEEEEESPESTQTQTETVTTITTIREIHSDPQPAMDRYETYSRTVTEEDQRVQTPEPEAKKGFVYLKEYVNATELSLYNARDLYDGGSDHVTSSTTSYSYSSPSSYSSGQLSSTCNFCGELVGNDAKITIEHLNINCHPICFKCGVCNKPMGDLLDSMFLHGGKVHCETCYSQALD